MALTKSQMIWFLLFSGWIVGFTLNPMGPLWSISVEEMFYAVWPLFAKCGRRSVKLTCLAIIPASLVFAAACGYWYDPGAQFLFFAGGGLLALTLDDSKFFLRGWLRLPAAVFALICWLYVTESLHHPSPDISRN